MGRIRRTELANLRTAVIAVLICALVVGFPDLASASTTGFRCSADGCKYAQGKVDYTSTTITAHSWWGSTASGTCDPTNNIDKWQLRATAAYNDSSGVRIYHYESGIWRTNCQIVNDTNPPWAWTVNPNVSKPSNPSSHFWWRHSLPGPDFYPYVRWDY